MEGDAKREFARKILGEIESGKIKSRHELDQRRFFWSAKLGLSKMPSNPYILSQAKKPSEKILSLVSIKPTRSLSGVQVVAVMLPPFACPGECIYCPPPAPGKEAPRSYTGFEPSTMRAQRHGYDSYKIVSGRIAQLDSTGNFAEKIELIFQGSSFTAMPKRSQSRVVKQSLDAVNGRKSRSLEEAKKRAEKSERRVVGITYETRPDLCKEKDIDRMLHLAGTRVELGVQNPDDEVYERVKRNHSVKDVAESTQLLKDSAFKVLYHLMPGLPGSNAEKDLKNFRKIFSKQEFMPDMVKFYPVLVIKGTRLYEEWKRGDFEPMSEEETVRVLAKIKSEIPPWVRVMRVNRDIPGKAIAAGIKKTNIRQFVQEEMRKEGKACRCIRCREAGLASREKKVSGKPKLLREDYDASGGKEIFLSFENRENLFGFLRLRIPHSPFRKEITPRTALVRELHVYGKVLGVGKSGNSIQHKGTGKMLMAEAERIAREEFDSKKMLVISGIGVKEYYRKNFGYKKDGPYVSKKL